MSCLTSIMNNRRRCLFAILAFVSLLLFVSNFNADNCQISENLVFDDVLEVFGGEKCSPVNWSNPQFCDDNSRPNFTKSGVHFNLSPRLLQNLEIPLEHFIPLSSISESNFVFVTASNGQYFHSAMDAIAIVQRFFPNHSIYFYDLSNRKSNEHRSKKIGSLCQVYYRQFDFSLYPSHVKSLTTYAFKPLIVHEMLREFEGVFWIDSSVRFLSNNLSSVFSQVYSNNGILTFARSHHSNFAATHPQMYRYLPISAAMAGGTEQRDANSILFFRTRTVYTRIVVWWVLCALQEDCMASGRGLLACSFKGQFVWAGCHRFDQSAINILLATHFQYDDQRYLCQETVLFVQRGSSRQELIETCPDKKKIKSAEYFR